MGLGALVMRQDVHPTARVNSRIRRDIALDLEDGVIGSIMPDDATLEETKKLYKELQRGAPGIFDRYRSSDVLELVDIYGADAVIEGYTASVMTKLAFAHEVAMASGKGIATIDSDIMELMAEDQGRGTPNPFLMYPKSSYSMYNRKHSGHFERDIQHPLHQ